MSLVPSPFSRMAGAAVSGLVSTVAQSFAGLKTFLAGIISPSVANTNGTGASDVCVKVGTSTADGSVNAGARLLSLRTGIGGSEVEHAYILKGGVALFNGDIRASGRFDQSGSDSSASPGGATINKPSGKSAIASGSTSVDITNSLVTAASRVMVTWHGDHGNNRWWVVPSAGKFIVTLPGTAAANTTFSWEVNNIL